MSPEGAPPQRHRQRLLDKRRMEGATFSVQPGAMRSLGHRGQDHFESGVPGAIKGLGVAIDKLLGFSGVPSH